jgi:hypothetical protein
MEKLEIIKINVVALRDEAGQVETTNNPPIII